MESAKANSKKTIVLNAVFEAVMSSNSIERDAFVRAIVERPDDDLPRLVYADWLEDQGEPERAEFIRVQCEIAELEIVSSSTDGACPENERIYQFRKREKKLLSTDAITDWIPDLPGLRSMRSIISSRGEDVAHIGWKGPEAVGGVWIEGDFARGFVSEVRLPLAAFFGGECPYTREYQSRVSGHGEHPSPCFFSCATCGSTGQRPGLGRIIAESQPVERCVLTGSEPVTDDGDQTLYCWGTADDPYFENGNRYELPPSLFDLLPTADAVGHDNDDDTRWLVYPAREAATDALSEACWLWANRPRIEREAEVGHIDRDPRFPNRALTNDPTIPYHIWYPTEAAARVAYFLAYAKKRAEAKKSACT